MINRSYAAQQRHTFRNDYAGHRSVLTIEEKANLGTGERAR